MCIARVRLSHAITIPLYNQTKASMVSSADGLGSLEPKFDLSATYNVSMSNGVAEVLSERPFEIFLINFAKFERRLPKGMLISHSIKIPLTLMHVGENLVK